MQWFEEGGLMSADLIVYLPRSAMPSPARWADAITQMGFPVELDTTDFDVESSTGFRPCRFRGEWTGFEYYSDVLTDQYRMKLGLPAGFDFSVNLLAHIDHHEWETAVVAAGVLCWLSRGVLHDPQEGTEYRDDGVMAWVAQELARVGSA
jgi:hypothetical protein